MKAHMRRRRQPATGGKGQVEDICNQGGEEDLKQETSPRSRTHTGNNHTNTQEPELEEPGNLGQNQHPGTICTCIQAQHTLPLNLKQLNVIFHASLPLARAF